MNTMEELGNNNSKENILDRSRYVIIPGEVEYFGVKRQCIQVVLPDGVLADRDIIIQKIVELITSSENKMMCERWKS